MLACGVFSENRGISYAVTEINLFIKLGRVQLNGLQFFNENKKMMMCLSSVQIRERSILLFETKNVNAYNTKSQMRVDTSIG